MTLEEIFDHGKEAAKHIFDMQGNLHPMWIIENKKGEIVPMMVPMTGDKDEISKAIKKALKKLNTVRYVSMVEAWMLDLSKDKKLPESVRLGAPLSQHPDRREIVAINAEDKDGHTMSGMFYILRPEIGKPRLSSFREVPGSKHEGRFVNLLE